MIGKTVFIVEEKTGKIVLNEEVFYKNIAGPSSDTDYFAVAWKTVVENGDADDSSRSEYKFSILPD